MALDGGGGGGGPVGVANSFTGAANTIEKVGLRSWGGWSGIVVITTSDSPVTMFEFLSPNKPLKMRFTFCVNDLDLGDGNNIGFQIQMNGSLMATVQDSSGEARSLGTLAAPLDIIIPSSTEIIIQALTDDPSNLSVSGVIVAEEI